eukprot:2079274-Alexandrium_andersonii.AAC.1
MAAERAFNKQLLEGRGKKVNSTAEGAMPSPTGPPTSVGPLNLEVPSSPVAPKSTSCQTSPARHFRHAHSTLL